MITSSCREPEHTKRNNGQPEVKYLEFQFVFLFFLEKENVTQSHIDRYYS